jgi:inhibitor of cysteine peptidase
MIEISDSDSGSSHLLSRGEEVLVRLRENPTTGYRWQLTQAGAGRLGLVDDRFEAGSDASAPGTGGHRVVRFVAEQTGSVRLEAEERRQWDQASASNQRRHYTIVVR